MEWRDKKDVWWVFIGCTEKMVYESLIFSIIDKMHYDTSFSFLKNCKATKKSNTKYKVWYHSDNNAMKALKWESIPWSEKRKPRKIKKNICYWFFVRIYFIENKTLNSKKPSIITYMFTIIFWLL